VSSAEDKTQESALPRHESSRGRLVRRAIVAVVFLVLVGSIAAYVSTHEPAPSRVRIAAGRPEGLFFRAAQQLAPRLSRRIGVPVDVVATEGSIENADAVRAGRAELALVQATATTMRGVASVAPIYPDVYVVVARKGRGIATIADFAGRPVAIGRPGSGVHRASVPLLARHGVDGARLVAREVPFSAILEDGALDGAIVVTGMLNPELHALFARGSFDVLPIEDADGVALRDPFLVAETIPRGAFGAAPMTPPSDVRTLATTAVLIARPTARSDLVTSSLEAIYEEDLAIALPTLIPEEDARRFRMGRVHHAARDYHDPYAGMDVVSNAVQAIDAGKELLVAMGAAVYLLVDRIRRQRAKVRERAEAQAADALDAYLDRTVAIEREQLGPKTREELLALLDQVTIVKLEALSRLSSESLRGDRRFLIFLTQCASLAREIQAKIALAKS